MKETPDGMLGSPGVSPDGLVVGMLAGTDDSTGRSSAIAVDLDELDAMLVRNGLRSSAEVQGLQEQLNSTTERLYTNEYNDSTRDDRTDKLEDDSSDIFWAFFLFFVWMCVLSFVVWRHLDHQERHRHDHDQQYASRQEHFDLVRNVNLQEFLWFHHEHGVIVGSPSERDATDPDSDKVMREETRI
jgi:hypothetical protein